MLLLVPCQKPCDYVCEGLLQSPLLWPTDLYVCVYASAILFLIDISTFNIIISLCVCVLNCFSCVQLFATPWTVARQASLSVGSSRQKHRCGLPSPSPGDLPDPGIKPAPLTDPALAGGPFATSATGRPQVDGSFLLTSI